MHVINHQRGCRHRLPLLFLKEEATRVKRKSAYDDATPGVTALSASPFARRKFERELEVCERARRALLFCGYRRAPEHLCYARPSSRPDVLGMRRGDFSVFVIDLAHPLRWHEEVYRRGLAGASGHFVFEAVAETEGGGLVVLCARQGAGCSLRLAYAVAHPERGSWRLGRRGLPEGYIAPRPRRPYPRTITTQPPCEIRSGRG